MNRFSKVGISWFVFSVAYCAALISVTLFICQLGLSIISFFNDGVFIFLWKEVLHIALKKGSVAGATLGAGLWLKDKLYDWRKKHSGCIPCLIVKCNLIRLHWTSCWR